MKLLLLLAISIVFIGFGGAQLLGNAGGIVGTVGGVVNPTQQGISTSDKEELSQFKSEYQQVQAITDENELRDRLEKLLEKLLNIVKQRLADGKEIFSEYAEYIIDMKTRLEELIGTKLPTKLSNLLSDVRGKLSDRLKDLFDKLGVFN